MEQNQNIGKWIAKIDNSGKTSVITVTGTFPAKGEKPLYHLRKGYPQGINSTELILTLIYGHLADLTGKVEFTVHYSEYVLTTEEYKTMLVRDEDGRIIANISISEA